MNNYKEKREKSFKKMKGVLIGLISAFSAFLFAFGIFMVVYQYDTNTVVFGVLLLVISFVVLVGDIFVIRFWKGDYFVNNKYEETNIEISNIEKEIEEIKKKNNL